MSEPKRPEQGINQIAIRADDAVQAGHYSNLARISHSAEVFQIDYLVVYANPAFGKLQSRVILTPGHAKRFLNALQENIDRFERAHGTILITDPPPTDGVLQ